MRVLWTRAARQDRHDIWEYMVARNPAAAEKMDRLFSTAADALSNQPFMGRTGKVPGTRELIPHEHYRLIHEIDHDTVWIVALIHTARQWPLV